MTEPPKTLADELQAIIKRHNEAISCPTITDATRRYFIARLEGYSCAVEMAQEHESRWQADRAAWEAKEERLRKLCKAIQRREWDGQAQKVGREIEAILNAPE